MCCHMFPDMELLRFCTVTVDPATVARAFRTVLRNRILCDVILCEWDFKPPYAQSKWESRERSAQRQTTTQEGPRQQLRHFAGSPEQQSH